MGVECNHYQMIGVKLTFKEYQEHIKKEFNVEDSFDIEEPYHDNAFTGIHHHNGLCIISDGMNGKYACIGVVLKKSDNYSMEWDYENKEKIPSKKKIAEMIKEQLKIEGKVQLYDFPHYR